MKLTKQQAIEGRRKMWNWIADEIKKEKCICNIVILKIRYCKQNSLDLFCNCFCCEYTASKHSDDCSLCPLDWLITKTCYHDKNSLFNRVVSCTTWQEQADLARQIANLPERKRCRVKEIKK